MTHASPKRRYRRTANTRAHWQHHLAAQRTSGLTQAAYCREHQLCAKSFTGWKRKLAVGVAAEFIPVRVNMNAVMPAIENRAGVTIKATLPNGISLEFSTPDSALPTLLASLARTSC